MMANSNSTESILMAALSTLPPSPLSLLSHSISALSRRHLRRLSALLSSHTIFSLTLRHLHSLSLHRKSLLIARLLLSNLALLHHFLRPPSAASAAATPPNASMTLRDLDAALLLLLLCELHQHHPHSLDAPPSSWRVVLAEYASASILKLSSFGGCSNGEALIQFVDSIRRCRNLVSAMGCGGGGGGRAHVQDTSSDSGPGEGKEGRETAASAAAVVALPSVEASGGEECVICREEMKKGRDVCELPCKHLFHWMCILTWLKKRNTCPCCRRRLPTDDVRREVDRLMDDLAEIGGGGGYSSPECL